MCSFLFSFSLHPIWQGRPTAHPKAKAEGRACITYLSTDQTINYCSAIDIVYINFYFLPFSSFFIHFIFMVFSMDLVV